MACAAAWAAYGGALPVRKRVSLSSMKSCTLWSALKSRGTLSDSATWADTITAHVVVPHTKSSSSGQRNLATSAVCTRASLAAAPWASPGESALRRVPRSRLSHSARKATYIVTASTQLSITISAVSSPKLRTAGIGDSALAAKAAAVLEEVRSVAWPPCV